MCVFFGKLLLPQSFHGVHPGGAVGGVEAEENADGGGEGKGDEDGAEGDQGRPPGQPGDEICAAGPQQDADEAAESFF
ncbi:MAG: hypothetical protein K6U04_10920 [Armatimonadetes bacterium]|nr:hypothetical protein [Armatimonadota bacterium]